MTYALDRSPRDCMRPMTADELRAWYEEMVCPFCGASALLFERGPRGGLSVNIECPTCECRLNVIPGDVGRAAHFGQVIRNPRTQ